MGMGIAEVQKFLGHQDIATTQLYAVMETATLRKRFDAVTAQPVRDLLYRMEQQSRTT